MVINRRQAAEALVMRLMSASIAATAVITAVRAAINPRMAAERPAIPSMAARGVLNERDKPFNPKSVSILLTR
jgi:hypothetical protein